MLASPADGMFRGLALLHGWVQGGAAIVRDGTVYHKSRKVDETRKLSGTHVLAGRAGDNGPDGHHSLSDRCLSLSRVPLFKY